MEVKNGKITSIEVQKKNKDRVNVFVNYEFAFACNMELIYKEGISKGSIIDEESLKEIVYKEEKLKAKSTALKILERTLKTESEIREKLIAKGYDENITEETIEFLKSYNFINDESYVKLFVKEKLKSKGKNKIKFDLQQKGIDSELISKAFLEISDDVEKLKAKELCIKKYNILKKSTDDERKIKEKLFRYLVSRGYDFSLSNEIIKETINEFKEY
ncbi:MAG: recombination regulator RecX [Clostridium sp.]|uniref:recombination regulator RecX n=1 Tax=Clostridium sp. TaxID=1506 RepID=UPI002A863BA9|nr:recombination regulator RecX [Clostridium sp.]MDY5099429.1 recombination regulator RecX [Clostridium sp.]